MLNKTELSLLVSQKKTLKQMALVLGSCEPTVRKYIEIHKIPWKRVPTHRPTSVKMPSLKKLVAAGWKCGDLARRYKCHYGLVWARIKNLGISYTPDRAGPRNGAWKGGRTRSGNYIYVYYPSHPFATKGGRVLESRLVMEAKLGRYLLPTEVVHHKKGYKNVESNLEVFETNGKHLAETLKGKIPKWTEDGYRRILEGVHRPKRPRKKSNTARPKNDAPL